MKPLPILACLAWLLSAAPADAEAARAASTERMARLLAETARRMDPRANPFANGDRLALIKAVPAPSGPPNALARYLFVLGQESVLAGESAAAVDAFERLRKMIADGSGISTTTATRTSSSPATPAPWATWRRSTWAGRWTPRSTRGSTATTAT